MRLTERLLRAVLRLAPGSFRDRYTDEFLDTHRARVDRAASRGPLAAVLLSVREVAGGAWAIARLRAGLPQEVRLATRSLWRRPGYAATAIAVLALGIGANTAIFSAVNAFIFRPLPFADAGRLTMLYETNPEFGWTVGLAAPANLLDWREQVGAFADIAAYTEFVNRVTYVKDGEPVLFGASAVSGNFFSVLGARAALGRTFTWEETWQGNDAVMVLSHDLWVTQFGADPSIVGRTLQFGTRGFEVVGVMPPGFRFPTNQTQLWHTWGWAPESRQAVWFRRAHWVRPIARLAPGVTPAEADAQFQAVVRRLQADYPETNRVMGAGLMPLRDFLIRDVKRPLMILLGAVGLLLLLACANVANLTLVRAAERSQEMALRHALGAGRLRIARQILTESLVVSVVGGVVGLGLGWAGVRAMTRLTSLGIEGATSIALDARVVVFTFLAAAASGMVFGLAPALRSTGDNLHGALTEAGRGGSQTKRSLRMAGTLVAVEVALALLLAVGAGLMLRSFWLIRQVDPGFRREGVLAVQFTIPTARYQDRDNVLAFYHRLAEALEGRPEIERVGTVGRLPLTGTSWSSQFQAAGWPPERVGFEILHRRADRGYFEALDIPLIRGRLFEPGDRAGGPLVVVINETFAREHFPGEDPIGQRIAYDRVATESSNWYEIIGIVGDQHQVSPAQAARAEVFENRNQDWDRSNWVVIRTRVEPASVLPIVRNVLREIDPLIPIAQARPLRDVWRASMVREEFILTLLTVFGGVALLLAAVGVYGVAAQAARQRTREIGIRVALGAAGPDVIGLMLRRSLVMVGLGLAAGLTASLAAARALRAVLYGVAPNDPATLAAVVGLLATVAGLACYLPARRATGLDPVRSLRD
ncbi:MAG TPA: ABC transporter permease [Gemmatimonadales bacterium]|nr:ABC transporter permease [Gemmatimonadales bacterium]